MMAFRRPLHRLAPACLLVLIAATPLTAQEKRVLDHTAYDVWRSIEGERISADGRWVLYELAPRVGDAELVVRQPDGPVHRIARAVDGRFTADSRHALFTIRPAHDSLRALKLEDVDASELPPDTLGILTLATGTIERVPQVGDWTLPEEAGGRVVYTIREPGAEPEPSDSAGGGGPGQEPAAAGSGGGEGEDGDEDAPETSRLVVRDLATGQERAYEDVAAHVLSEDGRWLAYAAAPPTDSLAGVYLVDTATGDARRLMTGAGSYRQLALSNDGRHVAFLSAPPADSTSEDRSYALRHWRDGMAAARAIPTAGGSRVPSGWEVSRHGELWFSDSGERLFFGMAPDAAPEANADTLLEEERVRLDVWHWQDPYVQPMQLLNAEEERDRSYLAVVHLEDDDRVVQLETRGLPNVRVQEEGDADVALAETDVPYRQRVGIDAPVPSDVWVIDVETGDRQRVLEARAVRSHLSPLGRYVAWYDFDDRHWHAMDLERRREVTLSAAIPEPVWEVEDDHPMPPGPYGAAGWTEDDQALLIYDRYDIWAVDPERPNAPRRITEGYGRDRGLRLRHVDLDEDQEWIDPAEPMLLSGFDLRTKAAGFFRDRVRGSAEPEPLVLAPKRFDDLVRAEDADVVLYTREDVAEFPDLWVSDLSFRDPTRVSQANPQQAEYNWATVELVEWLSNEGVRLQGLVYRPENFDPSRRYPMMVYFYERNSDNLHEHAPPLPHRSIIRPTFYASRGYIVFVPDIVYQDGYPGESAMDAVMPGVLKLAAEPWIDESNVGLQGHSWGGYQIAYMLTQTDFFKAAEAGAPVANMTSAYGGIRWGSGMSRMFQYEHTQSRIGGSLWDEPIRFLENSPLFFLDKVDTPLLIMHNDEDGAVPWTQGIELFMGLRRLGKPAWMIVYNDEPHWPTTPANIRDWNIRMQQFFDHFLKGAPAPRWLVEGIPATEKGSTLGLELVQPAVTAEDPSSGGDRR